MSAAYAQTALPAHTTEVGMLWASDRKQPLAWNIAAAAARYREKCGRPAGRVVVSAKDDNGLRVCDGIIVEVGPIAAGHIYVYPTVPGS